MLVNIYSPVKSQKQNNTHQRERGRKQVKHTPATHSQTGENPEQTGRGGKATCCQEKSVQLTLYHILHSKERSLHDSGRKSPI